MWPIKSTPDRTYPRLDPLPIAPDTRSNDGHRDKFFILHDLGSGKSAQGFQEQIGGLLEFPGSEEMDGRVYLESVSPVPVTTLFNQATMMKSQTVLVLQARRLIICRWNIRFYAYSCAVLMLASIMLLSL